MRRRFLLQRRLVISHSEPLQRWLLLQQHGVIVIRHTACMQCRILLQCRLVVGNSEPEPVRARVRLQWCETPLVRFHADRLASLQHGMEWHCIELCVVRGGLLVCGEFFQPVWRRRRAGSFLFIFSLALFSLSLVFLFLTGSIFPLRSLSFLVH